MRDLWAWQEEMGIDERTGMPVEEDMPRYMPCEVVWDEKEDGKVEYLFVYVLDILSLA